MTLSEVLVLAALILIALKFGLRARLREIGRIVDRLVNVLLALIIGGYAVQLVYLLIARHN